MLIERQVVRPNGVEFTSDFIVEKEGTADSRVFDPTVEKKLLSTFAAIEIGNTDDLLAFADKFGLLGKSTTDHLPDLKPGDTEEVTIAEDLRMWWWEVQAAQTALELLREIDADDASTHLQLVKGEGWVGYRAQLPAAQGKHVVSKAKTPSPHLVEDWHRGNPRPALRLLLSDLINVRLDDHTRIAVLSDERGRFRLHIKAKNLLGAIWLQAARVAGSEADLKRCEKCGYEFEVSTKPKGGRRKDAKYCSDSCRVGAMRKRKAEAVELHGHGVSIDEIAVQVGSTAPQVEKWLKQRGR